MSARNGGEKSHSQLTLMTENLAAIAQYMSWEDMSHWCRW